jgi:hypothetical protein
VRGNYYMCKATYPVHKRLVGVGVKFLSPIVGKVILQTATRHAHGACQRGDGKRNPTPHVAKERTSRLQDSVHRRGSVARTTVIENLISPYDKRVINAQLNKAYSKMPRGSCA